MTSSLKYLYIDDNFDDFTIIKRKISSTTFQIEKSLHARSTEEALTILGKNRDINLIILDYKLQGETANDFLSNQKLKPKDSNTLTIIVSGYEAHKLNLSRSFKLGIDNYLNKNSLTPEIIEKTLQLGFSRLEHTREKILHMKNLEFLERMQTLAGVSSSVAHEVNNVLQSLNASIITLDDQIRKGEDTSEMIEAIKNFINIGKDVTRNVLSLSKDSNNTSSFKKISINNFIDQSINFFKLSHRPTITFSSKIPTEDLYILANEGKLLQVLVNITKNSAEAIDDQGEIYFELKRLNKNVNILIHDNGPGMNKDEIEMATKAFNSFNKNGNGLGIGLSIAEAIIKEHKGSLTVQSQPKKGTTIELSIPLCESPPESNKNFSSGFLSQPEENGKFIVLVDDENALLKVTKLCLESRGHTVADFSNPLEARDFYQSNFKDIDVVLTDHQMPEMNGEELINQLKHIDSNTLFIISSGNIYNMDLDKNIKKVQKPFDFDKLNTEIILRFS